MRNPMDATHGGMMHPGMAMEAFQRKERAGQQGGMRGMSANDQQQANFPMPGKSIIVCLVVTASPSFITASLLL